MNHCPPHIAVVVLCWNGMRWLNACLSSLQKYRAEAPCDILVIDNGSTDDSAGFVRRTFPDIALIETGRNLGFAGGNNVGITHALQRGATYILLLNQDTVVFEGYLRTLTHIAQTHPAYGILSPFQYDYEGRALDRVFETQVRTHTTYFHDLEKNAVRPVYDLPYVIGAAMLLRRDLIEAIGDFDPFYFLYFEEKDICRRALSAGYRIGAAPGGKIGHYHGQLHAEELQIADVSGYFLRNRQVFILKDPEHSFFKNLYIFFRYGLPKSLLRKYDAPAKPPTFIRALWTQLDVLLNLPRIYARRRWERRRIQTCLKNRISRS